MTLRQAIEHIDESLGDTSRDWGCEECRREHEQLRTWLVELEQLKESGAVPVVRCKDCKKYREKFFPNGESYGWFCSETHYGRKPDDFCSYAERKDNGNA